MGDISLLFDVEGGGELSGKSGHDIQEQLNSIVDKINAHPFEIKFKADDESLNKMREAVQKITESFGNVRLGSVSVDTGSATREIDNGVEKITQSATKAASAVGKITASLDGSKVSSIVDTLKTIEGIDDKGAIALAKSISEVGVTSGKVKAKVEELKDGVQSLISLSVNGKNANGDTLSYIFTYDKKTQEVKKTLIEVAAAWGEAEQKSNGAAKTTEKIPANISAIRDEIDRLNKSLRSDYDKVISGIGGESAKGDNASRVQELRNKYMSLMTAVKEYKDLGARATEENANEIYRLQGELRALISEIAELSGVSLKSEGTSQSVIKTLGEDSKTADRELSNLITDVEKLKEKYKDSTKKFRLDTIGVRVGDGIDSPIVETSANDAVSASEAFDRLINLIQQYKLELNSDTSQESFTKKKKELKTQIDAVRKALEEEADVKKNSEKADAQNLKDSNALSKAIVATNRAYKQATEALQKYTAAKSGKSSKQYADIEREAASLKLLDERLHNGTISQQEYIKATNKSRAVIQEATAIIKANGEAHLSLADKIKLTAERFSQYFGIAKLVNLAWRATRQMVQATIELDDAFTQLRIVTGATDSEMEKFSDTAIKLSKSLGQSVADVTKSIETFSRLGYNLPDASNLAEYATILANTAAVSTDEATTGLTSIIKGFQLDVEDAEHVSDVLIQVGQKYAVSAGELMEAFERSGAALNATNVSFEKAAGLIAAANASVQDSSTVGTALKTVAARIRGSKSDLEELGEDTTDLAEGFSKYAKEIEALTGFNIMAEGSTTEFKDLYDIMQGIAQVWDTLSDTSQARVSEILGGTRQLQVISSIIGNWKDATGAYADAMDSAGVATKANDTYMESATAHINQFKASFEELSADVLNSKLIGTIIDAGSKILGFLDSISKFLGSMPGDFTGLAVAISAALSFKNVGELINQFQFLIILRIEYAHEAFN